MEHHGGGAARGGARGLVPRGVAATLLAAVVLAALLCCAHALPHSATSYGSTIFHVSSPVPSSHQSVVLGDDRLQHPLPHIEISHDSPLPYKFEYKVHDQKNHNYHERAESSDGQVVRGFYSLLEPHGEVRVVKYRADHDGFQSEISRHGGRHDDSTHGGGLGATIGLGASHDLGSHGLGVSSVKEATPIHEDMQESQQAAVHSLGESSSSQWSAIEDPAKKSHPVLKSPAVAAEELPVEGALGGKRAPEQILLQQQKKVALHALQQAKQHPKPAKPLKGPHKFYKRPSGPPPGLGLHHYGPRPGGPRPHFYHRGPKRGPSPRARSSHVGPSPRSHVAVSPPGGPGGPGGFGGLGGPGGPGGFGGLGGPGGPGGFDGPGGPSGLGGPGSPSRGSSGGPGVASPTSPGVATLQRREARPVRTARPPPTPCQCSDPLHILKHGRKLP